MILPSGNLRKSYEPSAVAYIGNSVACWEKLFKGHKLAKIHSLYKTNSIPILTTIFFNADLISSAGKLGSM